ncbi:ROK family protein [Bifidobacterium sp.]|uniref:ROK family protein n=1 Tax=Bifidobacterium sp. TaxID=41200 RepID=UPI0039EC5B66
MASLKSINQDDLRNHNLSVLLDTILRSQTPLSRAELAKATGLTKATISLLVALLLSANIVKEGSPSVPPMHGRPSTPLHLDGRGFCAIGLQINTDGFGFIALDIKGDVIAQQWVSEPMEDRDPDDIFSRLEDLVRDGEVAIARCKKVIVGSALALPGLVTEDYRLLSARNLGWENLELKRFNLVRRLNPRIDNEANMAALSQIPGFAMQRKEQGLVNPSESFIYLSTDIGIGGAVVRDGQIQRGNHGFAGELGHISVDLNGPVCQCGRNGCLESYAGRKALITASGLDPDPASSPSEVMDELERRWNLGDAQTLKTMKMAAKALASGLATTINILDIDKVILGGLWGRFGDDLARRIEDQVNAQILGFPERQAHVYLSDCNMRPALLGAAQVGLRRLLDNPLEFILETHD